MSEVSGLLSEPCIVSFSWNVSVIAICVGCVVLYGTNKYIGFWTWHMVRRAWVLERIWCWFESAQSTKVTHSKIPQANAVWWFIDPNSGTIQSTAFGNTLTSTQNQHYVWNNSLEVCIVHIRRKRDCLNQEWRKRKRKKEKGEYNNVERAKH